MVTKAIARIPTLADAQKELSDFETGITRLGTDDVLVIVDDEGYQALALSLRDIKGQAKTLDELKKTMTRPLDEAKKAILNLFALPEAKLKRAELVRKQAISGYEAQLEARRRSEEARLRELQRKEQEKLEARADRLREQGKEERADAVLANIPPVPTVVFDTQRPDGVSIRKTWKAVVTDVRALISHVASNPDRAEWLTPNMSLINAFARATRGSAPAIPGIRFYEDASVASRSD